jgi:hypothetical protein
MGVYDAAKCQFIVGGRFITGFQDGAMVSSEKDEDKFSEAVDAQGYVVVSETHNPLGTISTTLDQTSDDVKYLNDLANSGQEVPVWVTYNGTPKEKSGGTRARVKKPAGREYAAESGGREFEIKVFDYKSE